MQGETVIAIVLFKRPHFLFYCIITVIKHFAIFTICAKLLETVGVTFLDIVVVSDLKKNIGGSTDLV